MRRVVGHGVGVVWFLKGFTPSKDVSHQKLAHNVVTNADSHPPLR